MRVLLAGKNELACDLFTSLKARPEVVLGVVTCASEPDGESPRRTLKALLDKNNVDALNTAHSHDEIEKTVRRFEPDILVSAGFDKIIRRAILDTYHCVNIHFGLLPRYRGCYSIPWAILNDDDCIGITLHKIAPGIDDGEIFLQETIANNCSKSCRQLYDDAVRCGVSLFDRFLDAALADQSMSATPQDEQKATYYPMTFPFEYRIPWKQLGTFVYNYIRACHFPPYSPSYTLFGDEPMQIEFPVRVRFMRPACPAGTIVLGDGMAGVAVLNGIVELGNVVWRGLRLPFIEFVKSERAKDKIFL